MHLVRIITSAAVAASLASIVPLGGSLSPLLAQQQKPDQAVTQKAKRTAGTNAASNTPALELTLMLIYSTLSALNQANATGNYTVFRELAAPGFQVANSTAKLSEIFAELRSRNFDLKPILVLQPELIRGPEFTPDGMLRVSGFFPTRPERLEFDLMFQSVDGRWRLFGIATDTIPVKESQTALAAPQASPSEVSSGASALPPLPEAKPSRRAATEGATPAETPKLPDVRDRVEELEKAPDAIISSSKPEKQDNPYNAFRSFR